MERPVYHIKGVMKEKDQAADFVGPLDLILHLLRKNRLSIRDIPLAELLDQYLAWMAARRELDLEVAGEFIAMASHLMLLKTKMLLREEEEGALSEMEALMASLEAQERRAQQARVRAVLPQLEAAFDGGRDRLTKEPEPSFARRVYRYSHTGEDLVQAMAGWRRRQGKSLPPDLSQFRNVVRHEPYRVERKAEELLTLLHQEGPASLDALVARSRDRSEVTAVFLALLELCRAGKIHLAGTMEEPLISAAEPRKGGEAVEAR